MRTRLRSVGLVLFAAMVSCGDPPRDEPTASKPKAAKPGAGAVAAAPGAPAPPPEMTKEQLLAEVRKRQLTNEDFVESEANRDPFHSFLSSFSTAPSIQRQHQIILEKFSLDEIKLIAIIGGEGVPARAMFLEPGGLGVPVSRGDHVSKSDATVTRIAPDRVFFQFEEDIGSTKPKLSERVIELHAGEMLGQ